jgi:hypothetical protein
VGHSYFPGSWWALLNLEMLNKRPNFSSLEWTTEYKIIKNLQ